MPLKTPNELLPPNVMKSRSLEVIVYVSIIVSLNKQENKRSSCYILFRLAVWLVDHISKKAGEEHTKFQSNFELLMYDVWLRNYSKSNGLSYILQQGPGIASKCAYSLSKPAT